MMKLYRVGTLVKEYRGCKDVAFDWFRVYNRSCKEIAVEFDELIERYDELIEGYNPRETGRLYAEDAIEEMFTETEATALKAYLDREHGDEGVTTIKEAKLPIGNNTMGVGAIAVGGGDDFYMLHKEPEYDLPFKAEGYYNLVGRDLIDGGGIYRHRLLLVCADGTARMQTNKEAAAMEDDAIPF
jgi:hypothetical protein